MLCLAAALMHESSWAACTHDLCKMTRNIQISRVFS